MSSQDMDLDQSDFERLLELRAGPGRFPRWSEQQANAAGRTSAKHQLLPAIRGYRKPREERCMAPRPDSEP
jgi:hypothetical protein